jgi:hypothetical protein
MEEKLFEKPVGVHLFIRKIDIVKLGYNDHDYNDIMVITNKKLSHIWSQMKLDYMNFHGYNEHFMPLP